MDMNALAASLAGGAGAGMPGLQDIDFKALAATMKATKAAEEEMTEAGELAYQQIIHFLGKDRMLQFLQLGSPVERIQFMYRHEAHLPILQVAHGLSKGSGKQVENILFSVLINHATLRPSERKGQGLVGRGRRMP